LPPSIILELEGVKKGVTKENDSWSVTLLDRPILFLTAGKRFGLAGGYIMIKNLIHCVACNQIIPNYEAYQLLQSQISPEVEWSDSDLARAKEFLHIHSGHALEKLSVEEDSCISEKPLYEPLRKTYFYAHNAQRKYLIRRTRTALDQPAYYEIIPGALEISNLSLKIQEDDIRKEIAAEKEISPLLKERMERFIQVFQDEIRRISPEKIQEEVENLYDEEGSTLVYGGLKNSRWERILNRCRLYFDESELKVLKRFVEENRNPPDVLSVQIERGFSIISLAAAEAEVAIEAESSTIVERKAKERRG
jgi:hypothetical protein